MAPRKGKNAPETSAMTQAAIRKLVRDSIAEALEIERAEVAARAAEVASNTEVVEPPTARRECTWKDFKISDPVKFKGTEGAIALIRWFEKTENVFLMCECPDVSKVKFATGMLLDEAMSWWNSYAQPIGMENAHKLTWDQFKKLMTKKFCPRTEVQKMETEFYELVTKGDDIETYIRKFQELAVLCPNMVPDDEKKIENFIGGLPESIRGDVISFDPQSMEEAIRITQKLMVQVVKGKAAVNNDNRSNNNNYNNNRNRNYPNNRNNNPNNNNNNNKRRFDYNQGGNAVQPPPKRQEVAKAYAAGPTEGKGYAGNLPKCDK